MSYGTSLLRRPGLRAYAAAFISYLMLVGQVAPLALAAAPAPPPTATAPLRAAPRPAPAIPGAPNIVATKTDAYPSHPSGKADPGDTVTYTVTITNTGTADATGVMFTDTVDPNTTLIASSSVLAAGDSYNTIGNVQINVPANQGLLANDRDIDAGNNTGMTASGGTTSAQGGTVAINSDGSFTYDPPVGFNGTDTFTYTATTSGGKTASSTARVVVAGKIWFVNNNPGACTSDCNGRLSHPFTSLANWQAVNDGGAGHPAAGDNVFVYESATSYTGPVAFLANQKLIGQDATASLISITGLTQPSGTDPLPATAPANGTSVTITTVAPATNAINVSAGGITLRGFTVGATTGAKIFGSSFGTLVVGNSASPDVTLNGSGQALNLSSGTLSVAGGFASVATTSSAAQGINLSGVADSDGPGSSSFSFGSTSVSGATAQGILIGTTTADLNFGNTGASGASDGVSFQNNSGGTRTFGTLTAGGSTGSAFLHGAGGGNVTVNGLATLSSAAASTIDIQSQAGGTTVNFSGGATLTKSAPGNSGVNLNADNGDVTFGGTLTIGTSGARFPAAAVTINGGTGAYSLGTVSIFTNGFAGINATNADGALNTAGGTVDVNAARAINISGPGGITTLGMTLGTVNSTGGANNVNVTNAGGTLTMTGGALSGASGSSFVVSGGNPTVSFGGTVTQNNAQRVVDIQGTTGGTVSFTDTTTAVTGGSASLGVHIGDTSTANGNVSFAELNLGTNVARMGSTAVTIAGGSGTKSLGTVSIFTTGTGQGIVSTNSTGAVSVTTGEVNSAGAAAVNIAGVSSGSRTPLNIQLISLSANGGANGLILTNTSATGSPGGFRVNGTGTTVGSGGTIQNTTTRGANINTVDSLVLKNMNFTNANTSVDGGAAGSCDDLVLTGCNGAIFMNGVTTLATLDNLDITGTMVENGITAIGVANFKLDNSLLDGCGNEPHESCVEAQNLSGTSTVNNTEIRFSETDCFAVVNTSTSVNLAVTNSTFRDSQTVSSGGATNTNGEGGFQFRSFGSGTSTINLLNSQFLRLRTQSIQVFSNDTSIINLDIVGNTIDAQADIGTGIDINADDTSTLNFNITGNPTIQSRGGAAVNISAFAGGHIEGRVNNNPDIEVLGGAGIPVRVLGQETGTTVVVQIDNNTASNVNGTEDTAIDVQSRFNNARVDATITRNTVTGEPSGVAGINLISGSSASPPSPTAPESNITCGDIGGTGLGNNVTNAVGNALRAFRIRNSDISNTNRIYLEGFIEAGTALQDTEATWNGRNNLPVSAAGSEVAASLTGTAVGPLAPPSGVCEAVDTPSDFATATPGEVSSGAVVGRGEPVAATATVVAPAAPTSNVTSRPFVSLPRAAAAPRAAAPVGAAPKAVRAEAKRSAGTVFRHTAEDSSAPLLAPEPVAQRRRKISAPVLTGGPSAPGAGGTVSVNIGTLAAGASVTITFQVTIEDPYDGGPNVSNQGRVFSSTSSFTTVNGVSTASPNTDDPDAAGTSDPTLTPVNATDIRVNDASAAEPASGDTQMLFTLTLSQPAPAGGISVTYNTSDGTATGGASCGGTVDYVTVTNGTATVPEGSQTGTIPVTVCADSDAEAGSETLTVTISAPSSGTIVDNQATGTITQGTATGAFIISELRTSGPGGTGDDFVEFYNNTDSPLAVPAGGYGIFKMGATCNDTPVLIGTIPETTGPATTIPARGHFLAVGPAYSLANYGGTNAAVGDLTLAPEIESDRNVAVFSTTNVALISSANRLDAVGFDGKTGGVCDVLREGAGLPALQGSTKEYTFFRDMRQAAGGRPKDTGDNATDFLLAATDPSSINGAQPKLGAPGPENLASPLRRDTAGIGLTVLDGNVATSAHPNRSRSTTQDTPNNSTFGTLTVRRRVVNNTSGNVTRLRFRIVEMTTYPVPPGTADLRARTSSTEEVGPITDSTTCGAENPPESQPCTVTVHGTTLETPPAQLNGGGMNSTLSVGSISLGSQLAPGESRNVSFLLGIMQTGSFRFLIIIEALP